MNAQVSSRPTRLSRWLPTLMLVCSLAGSAHAAAEPSPETGDGVRKLLRYLRCAVEIIVANDLVSTGAASTDCLALYLSEAN